MDVKRWIGGSARAGALCCAAWLLTGCATNNGGQATGTPREAPSDTEQLVQFVEQAASQVRRDGQDAIEVFADADGPWQHRDTYIFVISGSGEALYHGSAAHLTGRPVRSFPDVDGRPYFNWLLTALEPAISEAWAFYRWPRPSGFAPVWNAAYAVRVRGPADETYLVGAAVYELEPDRALLRAMAQYAAARLEVAPQATVRQVRQDTGPFVYDTACVLITDAAGMLYAAPGAWALDRLPDSFEKWLANGGTGWRTVRAPDTPSGEEAEWLFFAQRVSINGKTRVVVAMRPKMASGEK